MLDTPMSESRQPEASPTLREQSRKNETAMLQRLAAVGQRPVAEALNVSESTVSRWKDGDLERTALLLAYLGLQIVPTDHMMVDPHWLDAVLRLSHDGVGAARERLKGGGK